MTLPGTHDSALVALSLLVAKFASYKALDLAGRVRASSGWPRNAWLAASALRLLIQANLEGSGQQRRAGKDRHAPTA